MECSSRMDVKVEDLSPEEMAEKIAQLDHCRNQMKGLNADMRRLLDAADDEIALLHSENNNLRRQVSDLEKLISEVPKTEGESCVPLLVDDLNGIQQNEEKICELEKKCNMLKEQNEILTAQLKHLQQEVDQNQDKLTSLSTVWLTFEFDLEEAQLELLHRDETIDQKNQQLKHLEENVEECFNIIKDLRLVNQELKMQIEDRLNESYFNMLNDRTRENEGPLSPSLSFAEEIKLLVSPGEVKCSITYSTDLAQEESEHEKKLMCRTPTTDRHTQRGTVSSEILVLSAKLFLFLCLLVILAFVITGSMFFLNTLWSSWYRILQPYWNVHYGALPPI